MSAVADFCAGQVACKGSRANTEPASPLWQRVSVPRGCSRLLQLTLTRSTSLPQFEYVSQHLVFANCIPLILKFFNQNIMSYITAKNRYSHCWGREGGFVREDP